MVFLYQIEAWSKLAEAAGARYATGFPCLVLSAYSNAWLKRMLEPIAKLLVGYGRRQE
ncbi:hypothetical protein BRAO375_1310040 [Bradyrhizobium sp. ORS 375]|uniref:hypothetical protein n=1 Tax=Bradyrhizobium sp. (strain ORS 375) TaxID=566679 RepID=UPI00024095E9|nr:hypothetical protein [Bradyrhizobium sp. ORS 375]CCD91017.1 hypothetical protein BRAO375_1310040 [Bradyrhizobium sp. ORS 375]